MPSIASAMPVAACEGNGRARGGRNLGGTEIVPNAYSDQSSHSGNLSAVRETASLYLQPKPGGTSGRFIHYPVQPTSATCGIPVGVAQQ